VESVLEEDTLIVLTWVGELTIRVLPSSTQHGETSAIRQVLPSLQTINGFVLVLMLTELTQRTSVTIIQPLAEWNLTSL